MSRISSLSSITLAVLVSTSAWAQQPATRTDEVNKPAANAVTPPTPSGEVSIIAQQQPGEMLASEMKGLNVKNTADEQLGTVSDVVLSDGGKLNAVLIRVGGFLGIGSSDIAVAHNSVKITTDKDGQKVAKVETTREALEKAPRYVTVKGQLESVRAKQPTAPRAPSTSTPSNPAN